MQLDRIVLPTIVGLIVVLVIAGAVGSSSSNKSSSVNGGTRAVIVPTADAVRTVVVPPCGTGTAVRSPNATAILNTAGTTSVELPQGAGVRVVLVPRCGAGRGGSAGTSNLPSAVFVPRPGARLPSVGTGSSASSSQVAAPQDAQLQVTVPNGSPIRTIVVAPCEQAHVSGPAQQVLSAANRSTTAVAPPC
jgi:hypothetical protein